MYESKSQKPLPRVRFVKRMLTHLTIALVLVLLSIGVGMFFYMRLEHLSTLDAFLNSAMLLGGMGPLKQDLSEPGKIFAGFYALYCGLVVIVVTGLMLAPGVHHLMKVVHWESREN